jgi:hypothetical protein
LLVHVLALDTRGPILRVIRWFRISDGRRVLVSGPPDDDYNGNDSEHDCFFQGIPLFHVLPYGLDVLFATLEGLWQRSILRS